MLGEKSFKHVSELRAMSRLLAVQTRLLAEKGDNERAWKNVLTGYKLVDALRTESIIATQLSRLSIYGIVDQIAVDLSKTSMPSDAQCEAIANAVKSFVDVGPIVRSMDGERLSLSDWIFTQLGSDPWKIVELAGGNASEASVMERIELRVIASKPYRQFMQASCLDDMLGMVKFVEIPFWSAPLSDRRRLEASFPRWNSIGAMTAISAANIHIKHANTVAKAVLTGTAMSLMRHKLAHGGFPATLAECDTKFLPVQPVDPFSGKAPIYRLEGNGFVLYSIGENMKDDGGKPEPNSEEKAKLSPAERDSRALDLVWKIEGK